MVHSTLEPLVGQQTQLVLGARRASSPPPPPAELEADGALANDILQAAQPAAGGEFEAGSAARRPLLHYDIAAWTLVDEATLQQGAQSATNFECLLTLDGVPGHEQRQSVSLEKGESSGDSLIGSRLMGAAPSRALNHWAPMIELAACQQVLANFLPLE